MGDRLMASERGRKRVVDKCAVVRHRAWRMPFVDKFGGAIKSVSPSVACDRGSKGGATRYDLTAYGVPGR